MNAVLANAAELPQQNDLFVMLNGALALPPDVQRRAAQAARVRRDDVERGYYGNEPLPKDMALEDRFALRMALDAFSYTLFFVSDHPGDSARHEIAHLVPAASGLN